MKKQAKKNKTDRQKQKLERDIRDCMSCPYFWGNNNRCITSNCIKKKPPKSVEETECTNCPYYKGEGYCFPCMKKLLNKKEGRDVGHKKHIEMEEDSYEH